jgi:hypothetical protein
VRFRARRGTCGHFPTVCPDIVRSRTKVVSRAARLAVVFRRNMGASPRSRVCCEARASAGQFHADGTISEKPDTLDRPRRGAGWL